MGFGTSWFMGKNYNIFGFSQDNNWRTLRVYGNREYLKTGLRLREPCPFYTGYLYAVLYNDCITIAALVEPEI